MAGKRENQAGEMEQASEFLIPGKYCSHGRAVAVAQFCGVCLVCPAFFLLAVFQMTAQPGRRIAFAVLLWPEAACVRYKSSGTGSISICDTHFRVPYCIITVENSVGNVK